MNSPPRSPKKFAGGLARPPWFYRQWMRAGNRALFFDRLVQDCDNFVHYRELFNFYLVNHPASVKQVLQETHDNFDERSVVDNGFRHAFGDGPVAAADDHRKDSQMFKCESV